MCSRLRVGLELMLHLALNPGCCRVSCWACRRRGGADSAAQLRSQVRLSCPWLAALSFLLGGDHSLMFPQISWS